MKKILLSSTVAILLFTGCGIEDKKEGVASVQKVEEVQKEQVIKEDKTPEEKLIDQVKESTTQVATKIAEESKKVVEAGTEAVKNVSEKVSTKSEEIKKEIVEQTEKITDDVTKTANETKDKIEKSMNDIVATKKEESSTNGKSLYLKCAGCHGQEAQLAALGKSQIIKDWTKEQIVDALNGYKDGTYGGVMKGVMKTQVANLSQEEIEALGEYISAF